MRAFEELPPEVTGPEICRQAGCSHLFPRAGRAGQGHLHGVPAARAAGTGAQRREGPRLPVGQSQTHRPAAGPVGESPGHGTLGTVRTESWPEACLEWSSGTFQSFTKANSFLLQAAQPCSGPGGCLGRPAELRGPFHLRAICTGPAPPWGAGAFPAAGSGWAPPTEPQCLWTTGYRSRCGWGSGGRGEGPVLLHTWALQVPPPLRPVLEQRPHLHPGPCWTPPAP